MAVLTLPTSSRAVVFSCLIGQALVLYPVATHGQRSLWLTLVAFFIGGFVTDLISGIFHFSFDYVLAAALPRHGAHLGGVSGAPR